MNKFGMLIGAAVAALAMSGTANAETTYSGNVALSTDYAFRGISQTGEDPAVSGGFDVTHGQFYAGTWASTIDFPANDAEVECDRADDRLVAGVEVDFEFGVIGRKVDR
jgi:uncharacterized protein (TIGR02001 family)